MDTHGMKFVVDTTGVAKGFRDYKSAVDGIFASLTKFEAHVDKTMKGVAKASANPQALNAFKKAVSAFAKVDIDTSAARKLSALSAAMQGFKAPSAAQTNNTKRFFNVLGKSLPDLSNAYRSIKALNDLKAAMAGFRAPPASAAKNLTALAGALRTAAPAFASLRNVSGVARISGELNTLAAAFKNLKVPSASQVSNLGNFALAFRSFNFSNMQGSGNFYAALAAISNFRGPSPAQIRNLQNFVTAVAGMRVPPNAAAVAAALRAIAEAAQRAGGALGGLRGNIGSLGGSLGNLGNQARGASLNMMGLQNAFSGTFQVASVLRSLLGSLTIAELGRNFFEATNAAIQFKAQMGVLNKDLVFADDQMNYVRATANAFGTDMLAAASGFAKISIAADKSNMSVMQTRHIFEGMSTAMTVLGTSTAGQQDVWLALQQVMNKGYLSAEELNQQLNEKLPGAMAYATEYAESLGMSLEKGLKTKALDAAGVLEHISKRMKEDFGPAVAQALMRPQAQLNILRNNFDQLFIAIGEAGGNNAFASLLAKINERMKPEDIERYARAIGEGLSNAVNKLSAAFDWLYENWDSIKGPLSTTLDLLGRWMIVSSALQIGRYLVSPLLALGGTVGAISSVSAALGVLTATNLGAAAAGMAGLRGRALAAATAMLVFRNTVASTIAATRAAAASNGIMAASLVAIRSAGAVAATGLRALVAMMGGPLLLTLAAVGYAAYALWDDFSSGNAVIRGQSKHLQEQRTKLDETKNALDRVTGASVAAKNATNDASAAAATGGAYMDAYNAKINAATGGLWGMARAARAATIENLKLQQADASKRLNELGLQSGNALRQGAGMLWDKGQYGNSLLAYGRSGLMEAKSAFGFGPNQKETDKAFFSQQSLYRDITSQLSRAEGTSDEDWLKEYQRAFPNGLGGGGGSGGSPSAAGDGGSGGKGKGRTSDFESEVKKIERLADGLMDKLLDADPIKKIKQEYTKNLAEQAHALLNPVGYKNFSDALKADSNKGKEAVEVLISTMTDPKNMDPKVVEDLAKRYEVSVEDIVGLLRSAKSEFEDLKQEAAIKQLDKDFRSLAKGMDLLGDSVPEIGELKTNIDDITGLARLVMPNGPGFIQFLTDVRSGALDAKKALEKLRVIMEDPAQMSQQGKDFMNAPGVRPGDIADAFDRRQRAAANAKREAKVDLEFGTRLLAQRQDEIRLLQMSTSAAEVFAAVQEEVNRVRATGVEITAEEIIALQKAVAEQQALANQLKRNKEFFENNGVRGYINDVKSVGESINELDKNVLQSLEDQLFSLGTTGKFSFQAIFDTIQQGLIRFASQNLLKEGLGKLFGGDQLESGQPSLMGGLFKAMGFDYAAGTTDTLGASFQNPMHVVIDPTTGGLLFKTGREIKVGEEVGTATDAFTAGIQEAGNMLKLDLSQAGKGLAGTLSQLMSGMTGGGGGGGGLLGSLIGMGMSLIPGAGPMASLAGSAAQTIAANPGLFKEGGFPGSPVARASVHPSAFANAPHYAEGTPNTSGGHPAILHDNEAVIPLSRGRKVAVEMNGGSRGQVINNNFHVSSPDANSFRKSETQIATKMHMQAGRAYRRNHG